MGIKFNRTSKVQSIILLKSEIKNELKKELKDEIKSNSKIETKNEVFTGHKPIPLKIANKVMKSICKISIKTKKRNILWNRIFFEIFRFKKIFNDKLSYNKSKFRK